MDGPGTLSEPSSPSPDHGLVHIFENNQHKAAYSARKDVYLPNRGVKNFSRNKGASLQEANIAIGLCCAFLNKKQISTRLAPAQIEDRHRHIHSTI